MIRKQTDVLYVKGADWYRDPENYCDLQAYYRAVPVSRRRIPVMIHRDIFDFKGEILLPDGRPWPKPYCIYTVFDPENRWHGYYLKVNEQGKPVFVSDIIPRLQVYDIGRQLGTFESE